MNIPKMEHRTKEDIIEYMKKCAKQYVPEWRYDQENPDAGTAMLSLFADMMSDNIRRFNLSAVRDVFSFFDEVNAKMLPAGPAEGFVSFGLPEGLEGYEAEVPSGTRLLAQTPEGPLVFETQEEVLVRQMNIQSIYLSDPGKDAIYQVYDREDEELPSFFLFQTANDQENLQRHMLFFCFDRGLEIQTSAKAELVLQLAETPEKEKWLEQISQNLSSLRFSYGTEEGYREITEYTYKEGKLQFEITGEEYEIVRKEEFGDTFVIRAEILDAERFSQIYLTGISLTLRSRNRKPDLLNVNGTDQEPEDFLVFGERPSIYDEFYIASEEVLGKTGAQIRIEFDLDFVKIPLEELAAEKIVWKTIMKKRDFIPDREYDITIRDVRWEYYNGYGWKRLDVSAKYQNLFSVGEDRHGQRKRMEFRCPADMQKTVVNSAETYCIRARIAGMNNAFKTRGAYIAPVAGRFMLSYDYKDAYIEPVRIISQNNMEFRAFHENEITQKGFAVPVSKVLPDQNPSCYLGFDHQPVGGPLKLLFVMHDTMQRAMPGVEWEYLSQEGWKPMHPIDGTRGFHHTGLLSWFGSDDAADQVMFGERRFWIRMVDIRNASLNREWRENCPKITGIYPNSTSILGIETVEETYGLDPHAEEKRIQLPDTDIAGIEVQVLERADYRQGYVQQIWETWTEKEELHGDSSEQREYTINRQEGLLRFPKYMKSIFTSEQGEILVKIRYEHCRGDRGNLKAGSISQLERTIGFVSNVVNPVATVCGTARETVAEAVERNARILRHGYRCVSAVDYEDMAWEASRNISKVKCFSGYDENRKKQPGAVTLVVLAKEYGENSYSFEKTKVQIYEYLVSHMDENIVSQGKFHIVRPEMIRLDVKVSVEPEKENEVFRTRKKILEELERFLDPLHGNFYGEGWEIGTIPNKNQIIHALKRVDGVKHINSLTMRRYRSGRFEESEIREDHLAELYLLPESGNHEILFSM